MSEKYFNAKPSAVSNLGADVYGAARHHNETYENPEQVKQREFNRKSKANLKTLLSEYKTKFEQALAESSEAAKTVLMEYEYKKCIASCDLLTGFTGSVEEMRQLVLAETDRSKREILRKKYNALCNVRFKIKYRIRPIELHKYFEPKTRNSFTEYNGIKTDWQTKSTSFDAEFLKSNTLAVQYGNSVPDNERIYVSEKLVESIRILQRYFSFNFSSVAFSFGARGKAGSIAHYQNSQKVLAFNRHWDGALIHELGHAIDYHLGLVSTELPYEIRSKYCDKLSQHKIQNVQYYMDRKEIFARLFEVYCRASIPDLTQFMFFPFNEQTLPDLDAESLTWMNKVLQPVLKETKGA